MAETRRVRLAKQAKRDKLLIPEVSRAIISTQAGRRWLWLQLEFAQCFVEDMNVDPQIMAWNKGRRNFGLKLYQEFSRAAPELFLLMHKENTAVQIDFEILDPTEEEENPDG